MFSYNHNYMKQAVNNVALKVNICLERDKQVKKQMIWKNMLKAKIYSVCVYMCVCVHPHVSNVGMCMP